MSVGPVEENFTAASTLRESRQFSIKDSTNVLHVFICSNDLKSTDITSILITCTCVCVYRVAVLHSNSQSSTTYMKAMSFAFISFFHSHLLPFICSVKHEPAVEHCERVRNRCSEGGYKNLP